MPRNKRGKDSKSDSTAVRQDQAMGSRSGGGSVAYSPDISTRQSDMPTRGDGPTFTFGGVSYIGRELAPLRQNRIQTVYEHLQASLRGYNWHGAAAPTATQKSFLYDVSPAYRTIDSVWDNAYYLLRMRAVDLEGYRHLPSELYNPNTVERYVKTYLNARMMIGELTSWQKLRGYDLGHISVGKAASLISQGRVNNAWEGLSRFRMFPGIVAWGDMMAKPIRGHDRSITYHPGWAWAAHNYDWGVPRVDAAQTASSVGNWSYQTWDRTHIWDPSDSTTFQRLISTVETALSVLDRTAPQLSSDDKSDIENLEVLLRMLEVPVSPMRWNDWQPIRDDLMSLDTMLYRNAWIGADNVGGGGDRVLAYPWNTDLSGQVEIRGRGQPNPLLVAGMYNQIATVNPVASTSRPVISPGADMFSIGMLSANQRDDTSAATGTTNETGYHRLQRTFSQSGGWTDLVTTFQADTVRQEDPVRHHQYSERGQIAAAGSIDISVNDEVDFNFNVPLEDVGYHFLPWLSESLGIPPR